MGFEESQIRNFEDYKCFLHVDEMVSDDNLMAFAFLNVGLEILREIFKLIF